MTTALRTSMVLTLCLLVLASIPSANAQQLEPRRWGHLPQGAHYLSVAYLYTQGDIFLDPVLRIENARMEQHTLDARYVYSFGLAGRSARIDVDVPYVRGHWEGLVNGEFQTTDRRGIADPRVRFSVLLHGAPALSGKEFLKYRADHPVDTVVGAGVSLRLPVGEYYPDRLINLGSNRFVLRPELGVVHTRHRFSYELTGSVSVFSDNDAFFPGDSLREQDPLFLIQGHIVYTFRPGFFAALSAGYGFGGQSRVNGVRSHDEQDNYFWALTLDFPLTRRQGLKLAYAGAHTNNLVGIDSDNLLLAWSRLF